MSSVTLLVCVYQKFYTDAGKKFSLVLTNLKFHTVTCTGVYVGLSDS